MAEKRRPGFNIPLNFYDGPEVDSIPKRIRAAAVGVWSLAGNYAATQLTDGYVPAGILKSFGCTDAIRGALKVTINKKGELSPLWIDARNGGIQLTNWPKHQRTNDEVTAYKASDAERKRLERESKRNATTTRNGETSDRTSDGQRTDVQSDSRDPKTETETKTENSYVSESATEPNGRDSIVATPGAELVREIIPPGHPAATLTLLRIRSGELLKQNHSRADVAAALELWLTKPNLGPNALPSLLSEVIKSRAAPGNGQPTSKMRALAELANEVRAAEQAQATPGRKELT